MAEARSRAEWSQTSTMLALIANCHRAPKKTREFKPSDFDPYARPVKAVKADIGILREVFIDRKMPDV